MTVAEAVAIYGTRKYVTSSRQDIKDLSVRLYGTITDITLLVLTSVNFRYDWDNIEPNVEIKYLPYSVLSYIDDITVQ